jgi:NAD(P)-dependent dehydrogenase (short-subunit alcohol dehydrogenase family)
MSALPDLSGKTAVVTGGASGIGKGIATCLAAEGMRVVIADVEDDALRAAAAETGAVPVRTDVSDLSSVQALAADVTDRFGTVHVVCNNAGIGPMAPVAELTMDDWQWMIGVNLYGVIHGVHTFLPILEANPDGGHIVNTASMAGLVAPPRLGAYSVTKYGVVALTEVLAAELAGAGSKVGVSVLCPGTVRTNIQTSSRNRPSRLASGGLKDVDISLEDNPAHRWISPREAGAVVVRAIKRGDLYALTHPDWYAQVERRHEAIAAAFRQAADDSAAGDAAAGDGGLLRGGRPEPVGVARGHPAAVDIDLVVDEPQVLLDLGEPGHHLGAV